MPTSIADLWTPALWIPDILERMATFPALWNSGVVVRTPDFDAKATGAGTIVTMPFIKDPTDIDDDIQVENTAPDMQVIGGDILAAPILNRVSAFDSTALAAQVSGADPVGAITGSIGDRRLKQRQKTLLAILRGIMGSAGATDGVKPVAGALKSMVMDRFDETGMDATSDQIINVNLFVDACAALGELEDDLLNGCMWLHTNIRAALKKADENNFDKASRGAFTIETYRNIPLFASDALVRAGTTNGYVYETYLLTRGIIASGEKAQAGDTIDVASLQFEQKKDKNNWEIYDRTRFLMSLNGVKWTPAGGVPAGQSASNTELGGVGNWTLKASTANRCGAVCLRTNG